MSEHSTRKVDRVETVITETNNPTLGNWRLVLLNRLAITFFLLGTPVLIFSIVYLRFSVWFPALICVCVLVWMYIEKERYFRLRSWLFCAMFMVLGAWSLYARGLFGSSEIYLGAAVVVCCVFIGVRAGWFVYALSLLVIVVILMIKVATADVQISSWVAYLGSYLLVMGIITLTTCSLIGKTEELIDSLALKVKAQEEIEASITKDLQRLQFLVEKATDVIWTMDLKMNYTYVSPNIQQLRGYTPEEVIAIGEQNFVLGATDEMQKLLKESLLSDEKGVKPAAVRLETVMRHKDGSEIDVEVTTRFLRDNDGKPTGLIGTTRDIGDQKRLEKAMESVIHGTQRLKGADFLDSLVENLARALEIKGVFIGRLLQDGKVSTLSVWMDDTLMENFEYDLAGTPCKRVLELGEGVCSYPSGVQALFPDDAMLVDMGIESYLGTPLFDDEGKPSGILVCLNDAPVQNLGFSENLLMIFAAHAGSELSRRSIEKEAQSVRMQLMQSQKMESIGQLAGGVAHDFNNLLVVIQGYVDLADDLAADNPTLREYHGYIRTSAQRAAELTRQLLSFSRRQILDTRAVDLNQVLENVRSLLSRLLPEYIELVMKPASDLRLVDGDEAQLEQAVINLAVNARDAMPDGGRLEIETSNVVISEDFVRTRPWARVGDHVLLRVTDTGVGISPEIVERIYEPFFTTKPEGLGTGLGLSVLFGLVKQHGGFIETRSEPGFGSTFLIYLPIADGSLVSEEPAPSVNRLTASETLLLVEDEDQVRKLAETFLKRAGYKVICAEDGDVAVEKFEQHQNEISLVLLDVVLPSLGGRAVMEKIHAIQPGFPILFMSGYSSDGIHANFILDKELKLLQKPYKREELLDRVREMIEHA